MGSGQPNRAKSTEIALEKAGEEAKGAVVASDAFFPFGKSFSCELEGVNTMFFGWNSTFFCSFFSPAFNDAVEEACKAGVSLIVQPGGSVRDQDAIDCCNKYGVAMVFTGVRHFRH